MIRSSFTNKIYNIDRESDYLTIPVEIVPLHQYYKIFNKYKNSEIKPNNYLGVLNQFDKLTKLNMLSELQKQVNQLKKELDIE